MYKKSVSDIKELKDYAIYLSSDHNAYLNLGGDLNFCKPYNGLYSVKNKMFVENIALKVERDNENYKITNFNTLNSSITTDECLEIADTSVMYYEYKIHNVYIAMKIKFLSDSNILAIEYFASNENNKKVNLKIIPLVTYKDVLACKKTEDLKFNKKQLSNGVRIDLSVLDNNSVFLKSDIGIFKEIDGYLKNVTHELNTEKGTKEIIIEDLYVPGEFDVKLKPKSESVFRVYISNAEFEVNECILDEAKSIRKIPKVSEEFIELKKLTKAIIAFDNDNLTSSIPSYIDVNNLSNYLDPKNSIFAINELIKIVNAIEGQYIVFKNLKKAIDKLKKIIGMINIIGRNKETCEIYEFNLLKLWTIECINKVYEVERGVSIEFEGYIKEVISNLHKQVEESSKFLNNLEYICLSFNTFKIYENMYDSLVYSEVISLLKKNVTNKFYIPSVHILKSNMYEGKLYASADMVYSLSLSYPVLDGEIGAKVLDTIFKELYTPYGLRKYSKISDKNDFLIYPKYMAHFVKANLKQNGVTYASQKIAYNLVKELLQDIDKTVLNSCRCVYHEKGIVVDKNSLDLLTTAELIRLYYMFI